jgi:hypothetical protein
LKSQLQSLAAFKSKINLFSGLKAPLDGKPNFLHWAGMAAISTGVAPSAGASFDAETIDVTVAKAIGRGARFKSISVACNGDERTSYSSLGGSNTNPPETSPLGLYTRLFGAGFQSPAKAGWKADPQLLLQRSVLSAVADDRQALMANVGASDRQRLDQYFTSVREAETQIDVELRRPTASNACVTPGRPADMKLSNAVPDLQKGAALYGQLLAIGLACNQTRVFNVNYTRPASGAFMPGVEQTAHTQSHLEPIDAALGYQPITAKFGTYSMEAYASLLTALDGVKEGEGTLLDHSLVLAYADCGYAHIHSVDGIAMLMAGGACGRVKTGYHIADDQNPVTRVGLTIQQALGMPVETWGQHSLQTSKPFSEILV